MDNNIVRYSLAFLLVLALAYTCSGEKDKDFDFFTIEEIGSKQLELIVEASGTIEAISVV